MATTQEPTATPQSAGGEDVIDQLAGLAPDSLLSQLRAQRPEVVRHAEGSYVTLFEPDDPGGVSRRERHRIALRVAVLTASPSLADWHRARLRGLGDDEAAIAAIERFPDDPAVTPRDAALLRFTDRLTRDLSMASPEDIADLKAAGLAPRDIVIVAQLLGFLSFQVRTLSGLRLLGEEASAPPGAAPRHEAAPGDATRYPFTLDEVGWHSWVETVDEVGATPEQAALVQEVSPRSSARDYYALLAHDVPVLRERTALMKAAMYGQGGLRRADRELGAVATARYNGCAYCASVHSRLFAQLTKDETAIRRLVDAGIGAELGERERAIVDYAVALTRDPAGATASDLVALRELGLSDLEILDLTHVVAMFAWANRLLQTLGEPVPVSATLST